MANRRKDRVDETIEMVRKPIYFDIPTYQFDPEGCGWALGNMNYELKHTYDGKYIFSHEEKLPPFDSKGQYRKVRRHYFVDMPAQQTKEDNGE